MNRDSNRSKPIDGNAILSAFHKEQNQLPMNYGMIRNNATGQTVERVGGQPVAVKPTVKRPEPTQQQKLKSLSDKYNTMLVQNDMNYEPVDYNTTGFTDADYGAEIERLNQRINDRQMEHNQTINGGKYAGMELEGGMPSSETVDAMNDDQFTAYMKTLGL